MPSRGGVGGHLGGERGRLARALEARRPASSQQTTLPSGSVIVTIIVEAGLDVCDP